MGNLNEEIYEGKAACPTFLVTGNAKHSSIDELGFQYTAHYKELDGGTGRYFIKVDRIKEFSMSNILRAQPVEVNDPENGVHASGDTTGYIAIKKIWFVDEGIYFFHEAKP